MRFSKFYGLTNPLSCQLHFSVNASVWLMVLVDDIMIVVGRMAMGYLFY